MVNEIELSLELSIGGSYGTSKKSDDTDDAEETGLNLGGSVEFDPQAKHEIQALRRQEARKKREGKLKKTNGYGSGDGGGGAQESRVRVRDNEDGGLVVGPASKREKLGNNENVGLVPVGSWQCTNGFANAYGGTKRWGAISGNGLQPAGSRSFRPYRNSEQKVGKECGLGNGSSVSPGRSSSAFSDYQSSTLPGGNISDNGSNSSYSQAKAQRRPNASETSHPPEQSEHSGSSKQIESFQAVDSSADSDLKMVPSCVPQSGAVKPSEEPKSDTHTNPVVNRIPTSSITTNGVTCKAPRPQPENPEISFRPQMPCVSTTGNGPDGRTVMGFLYRYTKTEVCIVCVCHGSSFTPAEFVKHAGGIDIAHPLRHITVIPSS